jgi:hypothetical protein
VSISADASSSRPRNAAIASAMYGATWLPEASLTVLTSSNSAAAAAISPVLR